jgi:hypothetical protein
MVDTQDLYEEDTGYYICALIRRKKEEGIL